MRIPFRRRSSRLESLSRLDQDLRDEIRFHLEARVDDLKADGLDAAEAWRQAVDAFGDPDEILAETKREHPGDSVPRSGVEVWMSAFRDLLFAIRTLRKRPMFAVAAVVSLGLGIGANTAIFSVINSLLVRSLNVADPDRLMAVYTSQVGGNRHGNTSYPDYLDYKERNQVFQGLASYAMAPMSVRGDGQPVVRVGQVVSWDFFDVLGVDPIMGRTFSPEEGEIDGLSSVAILSHEGWGSLFGADPEVLGRTVAINDSPFTVIGVAPPGFIGLVSVVEPVLWAPLGAVDRALSFSPNIPSRIDPWLQLVGRLQEGLSSTEAQAAVEVLAANLAEEYPETNRNKGIVLGEVDAGRLLSPEATEGASRLLVFLLAVVGFVLLVACFNVANLQLAKANSRRREIALRFSLGASRTRIVRQLLVESIVLSFLAGGAGLGVAVLALRGFQRLQPQMDVPLEIPAHLDPTVLGFTLLLAVLTGVVFGLAPALQVLRPGQVDALKDQGHGATQGRASSRIQRALVVGQVALSLVLLAGAGLFMRSLANTLSIDPGFDFPNGVVLPINLGYGQYEEADGRELHERMLEHVRTTPGVESAALTAFTPLGITHGHHDVDVEGYEPAPDELMLVKRNMVSSDYFTAMGVQVVRGRAIDDGDTGDADPVAMVNETMARRFWPDQDPIGRTIRADLGTTYTVVGIVEDGKYASLQERPESYLVLPLSQSEYVERMNLVVRTSGDPTALMRDLVSEVRRVAPGLPPSTALTSRQYLEYSVGNTKGPAVMVFAFGVLALVLATVGLYGVMWYTVTQRTREFGVRLALGASEGDVVKIVMSQGLKTTLVGVVIGLVLALTGARLVAGLLYQVGPLDPLVFSLVPAVLILVGQVASFLPARHASRSSPVEVMRAE